jgi:hypothetical protein
MTELNQKVYDEIRNYQAIRQEWAWTGAIAQDFGVKEKDVIALLTQAGVELVQNSTGDTVFSLAQDFDSLLVVNKPALGPRPQYKIERGLDGKTRITNFAEIAAWAEKAREQGLFDNYVDPEKYDDEPSEYEEARQKNGGPTRSVGWL